MNMRIVALALLMAVPVSSMAAGIGIPPAGPAPLGAPYAHRMTDVQVDSRQHRRVGPGQGFPGGRPEGPGRHMPPPERIFDMMDSNHDGMVSRSEFAAAHQRMMQHRMSREGGHGDTSGRR